MNTEKAEEVTDKSTEDQHAPMPVDDGMESGWEFSEMSEEFNQKGESK